MCTHSISSTLYETIKDASMYLPINIDQIQSDFTIRAQRYRANSMYLNRLK